ncbi:MAG: hypothetical protein ACI4BI_05110 [Anaerotardibacter sp.]
MCKIGIVEDDPVLCVELCRILDPEVVIVNLLAQAPVVIGLSVLVVGFAIYGVSLVLSVRFYSTREL